MIDAVSECSCERLCFRSDNVEYLVLCTISTKNKKGEREQQNHPSGVWPELPEVKPPATQDLTYFHRRSICGATLELSRAVDRIEP